MKYEEKRKCKRKPAYKVSINVRPMDPQVWFSYFDGFDCSIEDISLLGIGISSGERLPVGTPLSIDLRFSGDSETIRVFGKIAWTARESDTRYRSGICFSWWKEDKDKKIVDNFVETPSN